MNKTTTTAAVLIAAAAAPVALAQQSPFDVAVFHNNDGESALLPVEINGVEVGGAARFKSLLDQRRTAVGNSIFVSSGDNFLAGPVLNVSRETGTLYDARFINALGYDALAIGNHEFDLGPGFLADFIGAVDSSVPFLSANLDFSGEAELQALADAGRIRPRTVVTLADGSEVGLIGLTTPDLPTISNPGNVSASGDLARIVNEQAAALEAEGVTNVVLLSHLQGIDAEIGLIGQLVGVDAVIGGGGDELLLGSNPPAPGDENLDQRPYPIRVSDADGNQVPVVTTTGQYNYLGQLNLSFGANGQLTGSGGDAFRVVDQSLPDGVAPDAGVQQDIIEPLLEDLAALNTVVGRTEVTLDGTRSLVRTQETNYGSLIADAILDAAQESSPFFGADAPIISLTNGGGIRNSVVIPAGDDITQLAVDRTLPFGNQVTIVEDVSPEQLLLVLERAVSAVENVSGRFAQIGGFSFTYDPDAEAAEFTFDDDGNITEVVSEGARIIDVTLDSPGGGVTIIEDGEVLDEFLGLMIDVATVNFLADGGDGYPFPFLGLDGIETDVDYADALASFIADDLNGVVTANLYPEGGLGRITVVPEPAAVLSLVGVAGFAALRRRRA